MFIFGFLTYFLVAPSVPSNAKFEVGKPAPFDARASYSVRLVDEEATRKARQDAAAQIADVEKFNPYAIQVSEAKIDNTISLVRRTLPESDPKSKKKSKNRPKDDKEDSSPEQTTEETPQYQSSQDTDQAPISLSSSVYEILINADDKELHEYSSTAKKLLRQTMNPGISDKELNKAASNMIYRAAEFTGVSNRCKVVAVELASKALIANRHYDATATDEARRIASEQVIPTVKVIVPGQIVVREGEIVTEQDLPVLEALDYYHHKVTARELLVKSFLVVLIMLIGATFVRICAPNLYEDCLKLFGLSFIILIYTLISHYLITAGVAFQVTPIVIPAILIAILFDSELAILVCILLTVYTSVETSNLTATAASILTTMVAVLSTKHIKKRWDLIRASAIIWVSSICCNAIFTVGEMANLSEWIADAGLFGTINGLLFSLLASGLLPFMESMLNVTSHMRLLELSNPSEPALHELLSKAPGTYQHSLMVSNLAAAAAQEVGADALLCRTGAFYHDIGKTKQPNMFIENQFGQENPHDKLPPTLSAMILISHVKFGYEMAQHYKLPPIVTQFIMEHHGDNLASFFYQKAQAQSSEPLSEEDFRYPGPKPQSKETAIVMLCDGIEAAARTLPVHNRESITNLVERMVSNALQNGQLDDCPLSLRDLTKIKRSIVMTLTSHYHSRISYPNMPGSNGTKTPEKQSSNSSEAPVKASEDKESASAEPTVANSDKTDVAAQENKESTTLPANKDGEDLPIINQPETIEELDEHAKRYPPTHVTGQAEEKPRSFPAAQRSPKNSDASARPLKHE